MKSPAFKLLTINTWKGDGQYRQRMAVLKQQLGALQPDVVACQEALSATGADTTQLLAETLALKAQFAPARYKLRRIENDWLKSYSGLALLSRYPISAIENVCLPTDPRDGERTAQLVQVDYPELPVLVINTHLTHLRDSSALRIRQLEAVLTHLAIGSHRGPIFLCGDFNAAPTSAEIQFLLHYPALSVQDTYLTAGGALPGFTMIDQTTSGSVRSQRIDYIFSIAHTAANHPIISNARVVLNQPGEADLYASDHFGVMIDVQFSE